MDSSLLDKDKNNSSTWEEVFLSSPSYIFLVPISPEFYTNVDNLKDIVSDESELQMLISNVFKLPFDSANESESDEEEEKRENRYREFYAAVHRRYILTQDGMNNILKRQSSGTYGICPCCRCQYAHLFPAALSDIYGDNSVKLFCPSCKEVYNTPSPFNRVDGAYFGSAFIPTLVKEHPEILLTPGAKYEPRIFGYKIHCTSPYYRNSVKK